MNTPSAPICEAFAVLAQLLVASGLTGLNQKDGLCNFYVDEHWKASINAHDTTVDHVPAFHAAIEYNGWPAGLVGPYGGMIAAGECANETTFISALRAALDNLEKKE